MNRDDSSHIRDLLRCAPFELPVSARPARFLPAMRQALDHHIANNPKFAKFCARHGVASGADIERLSDVPALPVRLFKRTDLSSVPESQVRFVLTSSTTTGQPSIVPIDDVTARRQVIASTKVIGDYLGPHLRPFMLLDSDPDRRRGSRVSARMAATRGFSNLAASRDYFLDDDGDEITIDLDAFASRAAEFAALGQPVCVFGLTYVVHQHLALALARAGRRLSLPEGSHVVHIGGWKKLEHLRVDRAAFIRDVESALGVAPHRVIDFYGFTEQMGLVYGSVGDQPRVTSCYAEIIIRDLDTLEPVEDGREGLVQILTPLPHSYPGISVLTEDIGRIVGRGRDRFGREGTRFEILGRARQAESRGCSDAMAQAIG